MSNNQIKEVAININPNYNLEKEEKKLFCKIPEQETADVFFKDKEDNLYGCHSLHIRTKSPVLKEIIFARENNEIIKLEEPTEVMTAFIKLLYYDGGSLEEIITDENVVGLWKFFRKYQINWESYCANKIYNNLNKLSYNPGLDRESGKFKEATLSKIINILVTAREFRCEILIRICIDLLIISKLEEKDLKKLDQASLIAIIIHYNIQFLKKTSH